MLEHHRQPLRSRREFLRRQLRYLGFSMLILLFSIGIGVLGYHHFGNLSWIDSFLNASMILTGMGPVETQAGKIFSAFYALFSGISFLTFVGVLFAPVYHRFLHKFHLEIEKGEDGD
jgi:hypothetical protein